MNLKKNTELVFQQIADASLEANRALDAVSVIAVTKYVNIQTAEALPTLKTMLFLTITTAEH